MTTSASSFSLVPSRRVLWACRLLCLTALGSSSYLAWTALNATEVYGCGGGEVFDCSHVLSSRYSKFLSLPVSVPAVGLYATLLGMLFFLKPQSPPKLLAAVWGVLTVGSISAGLAALWFTGIQVFELKHLCAYCLTAHACGIMLAGILLWKHPLGWFQTLQLSSISVAGIAVLVTAQLLSEPPQTFVVERYDTKTEGRVDSEVTVRSNSDAAPFEAPQAFDAPVEFSAPMEFQAPVEFDAPVVFAPPADAQEQTEDPSARDTVEQPVEAAATTSGQLPNESAVGRANDQELFSPSDPGIPTRSENTTQESAASGGDPDVTSVPRSERQNSGRQNASPVAGLLLWPAIRLSSAVRLFSLLPEASSDESQAAAQAAQPEQPPARLVTVAGNRFSLNSRHWPLLGDPDAKYIFVEMFDYTCPHCRSTHHAIEGAFKRYGDDLAVIALPVPLERACNDAAKGNGHAGSCELAKLAVAVWRCDQSKFATFHNWLFEGNRSPAQARAKAESLVGQQQLQAELALPHAQNYIQKHVQLYKMMGTGSVPKLMFPNSTMTGSVGSTATLVSTIQRELGR